MLVTLIKKKKKLKYYCKITINGNLTNNKNVPFTSKWLKADNLDESIKKFHIVLNSLSTTSLLIMFKNTVTEPLKEKLNTNGFTYQDKINLEISNNVPKKTFKHTIRMLYKYFSKLSICKT
ncbi:hypothetical protein ACFLYH_02995 [Candidatus Dependentiae bacterium]